MIALCQDCLRVFDIPPDTINYHDYMVWGGNHLCPCGGDVCTCYECQVDAKNASGVVDKFSSNL